MATLHDLAQRIDLNRSRQVALGDGVLERTRDTHQVHAVVLVEALVLDRHGRVLKGLGNLGQRDRGPDLGRIDQAELAAVTGVDDRVLTLVDLLEIVRVRRIGGDRKHPAASGRNPGNH